MMTTIEFLWGDTIASVEVDGDKITVHPAAQSIVDTWVSRVGSIEGFTEFYADWHNGYMKSRVARKPDRKAPVAEMPAPAAEESASADKPTRALPDGTPEQRARRFIWQPGDITIIKKGAAEVTHVSAPIVAGVPAAVLGVPWLTSAIRVVEVAIDSLVWEFVEHPYLHRVEHSLHARLIGILAAHPLFSHLLPIGDTGRYTQPIHKEWPETTGREEKGGRRGNFDLAVLGRDQLAGATLEEFRQGRVAPAIVIEVGLDYGFDQLRNDHDKLANSEVESGFLVHFSRARPRDPATEEYLLSTDRTHRTAYAHHEPTGICTFKTIDGKILQTGP